jgi:hypothetical protein
VRKNSHLLSGVGYYYYSTHGGQAPFGENIAGSGVYNTLSAIQSPVRLVSVREVHRVLVVQPFAQLYQVEEYRQILNHDGLRILCPAIHMGLHCTSRQCYLTATGVVSLLKRHSNNTSCKAMDLIAGQEIKAKSHIRYLIIFSAPLHLRNSIPLDCYDL